jgi:hypothetical protein
MTGLGHLSRQRPIQITTGLEGTTDEDRGRGEIFRRTFVVEGIVSVVAVGVVPLEAAKTGHGGVGEAAAEPRRSIGGHRLFGL